MSEDQCIRACRRPCRCGDCVEADEPQHEPQPSPAEHGLMCRRCEKRLWKWLTTVLDDTLRLDSRIPVDYGWDKESNHQKVTGSPALVRLDVAALTDPRTTEVVTEETEHYPENSGERTEIDIPGRICSWAMMFTEEHNLASPVNCLYDAVTVLAAWWDTLIGELWVDDFYADMQLIRGLLDLAHQVERPKPMGKCFTCEKALYSRPGCTDIRCGQCGRRYDGLSLVRLEIQRRREVNTQ